MCIRDRAKSVPCFCIITVSALTALTAIQCNANTATVVFVFLYFILTPNFHPMNCRVSVNSGFVIYTYYYHFAKKIFLPPLCRPAPKLYEPDDKKS